MIDEKDFATSYLAIMLKKAEDYASRIEKFSFIKKAYIESNGNLKIEFLEEVDIKNQDVFDLFIRGGMIKRTNPPEGEDEYFKVEGIGEF
ncbi:MAG: hypothetical protein ACOC1O_00410 [bacterium]